MLDCAEVVYGSETRASLRGRYCVGNAPLDASDCPLGTDDGNPHLLDLASTVSSEDLTQMALRRAQRQRTSMLGGSRSLNPRCLQPVRSTGQPCLLTSGHGGNCRSVVRRA